MTTVLVVIGLVELLVGFLMGGGIVGVGTIAGATFWLVLARLNQAAQQHRELREWLGQPPAVGRTATVTPAAPPVTSPWSAVDRALLVTIVVILLVGVVGVVWWF